jgi:hypothetical protein
MIANIDGWLLEVYLVVNFRTRGNPQTDPNTPHEKKKIVNILL